MDFVTVVVTLVFAANLFAVHVSSKKILLAISKKVNVLGFAFLLFAVLHSHRAWPLSGAFNEVKCGKSMGLRVEQLGMDASCGYAFGVQLFRCDDR